MILKTKTILALLLLSLICLSRCSNDLQVTLPGDPIPIVYGVVNPEDSFCYVTVSKSYSLNADVTHALDEVSLFKVDDAQIVLEAWGSGYKLWESTFSLYEDSSTANRSRSCYKSDKILCLTGLPSLGSSIKPTYDYLRLQVSSSHFKNIVYARVPIIIGPGYFDMSTDKVLKLYGNDQSEFSVKLDQEGTKCLSLICLFHYQEYTDQWKEKVVQFNVKKDPAIVLSIAGGMGIHLNEEFFNKIAAAIPNNPDVFVRQFNYMDFELFIGDTYLNDYMDTYLNVADREMNVYSNMVNGYGFFSVIRKSVLTPITFDKTTLDSLLNGRMTKHLNFKAW